MALPRNHYDNLKVAQNAPPEVIEAAYRALAKQFHPDRNPSPSAARAMRIISEAYEVLSDPVRRRSHDKWIKSTGTRTTVAFPVRAQIYRRASVALHTVVDPIRRKAAGVYSWAIRHRVPIALTTLILGGFGATMYNTPATVSVPRVAAPANWVPQEDAPSPTIDFRSSFAGSPAAPLPVSVSSFSADTPRHTRAQIIASAATCALNTQSWPSVSGYYPGSRPAARGDSSVTIDNTGGVHDAFVKLVGDPDSPDIHSVAWVLVKAHDTFDAVGLGPGNYAMYIQDVVNCADTKSPTFELTQYQTSEAKHFSTVAITLYTRTDGNIRLSAINPRQFDALNINPNY